MKRKTTHGGAGRGHPEFELDIGDSQPAVASGLLEYLERKVQADGVDFVAGDIVQYGSAVFRVAELPDGQLTLEEPEPGTIPPRYVRSVGESLLATIRQVHAADSVGLADRIDFPHPFKLGYVCTAAGPPDPVVFTREKKVGDDEGWSILCTDVGHDHDEPSTMTCKTLHEMAAEIPEFWLFAAFPEGTTVLLTPGYPPQIWLEGRQLMIQTGSYLDELFSVWV